MLRLLIRTYVYCVPTKRCRVALNDVDDILLSATASKCFRKLTNVTNDHVCATRGSDDDLGISGKQHCLLFWNLEQQT